MSSYASLSAHAALVVKIFVYGFGSAPTRDLINEGEQFIDNGGTPQQLLEFLFDYDAPDSPYSNSGESSDAAFVSQLIDSLAGGTTVGEAKRDAWAQELLVMKAGYADRAEFAIAVAGIVENEATDDPDLLAVRESLAGRLERAAAFADTPSGAHYDGNGFGQLQAALQPPAPTYELSASTARADEGTSIVFDLQTTHLAAGSQVSYRISGAGISAADLSAGALEGVFTVDGNGHARLSIALALDATTEGLETLQLDLLPGTGGNPPTLQVVVIDTSTTPEPTYQLSAAAATVDEGGEILIRLSTTGVAAGTAVGYTIAGSHITADDLVDGTLVGAFIVDASGQAMLRLNPRADALTEGIETLRLTLDSAPDRHIDIRIADSSRTPEGGTGTDTFVVADHMTLEGAGAPGSALEGEIGFDSHLTYDLLDQGGRSPVRLSVADLVASGSVAGAPLVLNNQSADRGNLPQVSNALLLKLDLGDGIDRVDYSAESGRVVAVVAAPADIGAQKVLVNDDGIDDRYDGPTDRIDALTGVEEIVASAGGGVIDLTPSSRDWTLTFSDGHSSAAIDGANDRAVHRIVLRDPLDSSAWTPQFLEVRDAGTRADLTTPTAAWSVIEGGDQAQTLIYSPHESMDARTANLRGGDNTVSFSALTSSVEVQVAITPFVASSSLADDRNGSGVLTATTRFTDGHGNPLAGSQANVTTSYTPDHAVAAGSLRLLGSLDAEDAVGFEETSAALHFELGRADGIGTARLLAQPAGEALRFSGFEILHDNGATDDVYDVQDLALALQGPRLVDGNGNDHDTVRIGSASLGHAALGGAGVVDLGTLNGPEGFNYRFSTLDISDIAEGDLQVKGSGAADETLVVGSLASLAGVSGFETLRLTDASIASAASLVLDLDRGIVSSADARQFDHDGHTLSAAGATSGLTLTVLDTTPGAGANLTGGLGHDRLTGGLGNDAIQGGPGNDVLDGGVADGSVSFTLSGAPDATTTASHRFTLTLDIAGTRLTLDEAAVADTQYGDGRGAVVDGASRAEIGLALVNLVQAHVDASQTPPGSGLKGARYDEATGALQLIFTEGSASNAPVSLRLDRGADSGSLAVSAAEVMRGSAGADRFVFEASGAANGSDTILNFGSDDQLDVTAFTGEPITAAADAIDGERGGTLGGGPGTAQFVFGRASVLTAADFAAQAQAGRLFLADGMKSVIAVSADPTGAHGDTANMPIALYFVHNGADEGLGDLSVSLVGTISGASELSFADIYGALG